MSSALWLACKMGAQRGRAEKAAIIGQCAILWALIVSYGVLFRFIPVEVMARLHLTTAQLTWYLVLTEIMAGLNSSQFLMMQDSIRSGILEIQLLRPVDFWLLELAEWFGNNSVRLVVSGLFALVLGGWITHSWPWHADLLLFLPLALAGLVITLCVHLAIGCLSLWLGECRPFYWLWQKSQFLLGALLWPLVFYPHWLQTAAWLTPFPATLAIPGNLALGETLPQFGAQFALQLLWVGLALLAVWQVAAAVRAKLARDG